MATDFFERQHAAHKQSGRLLALFVLAVILIILSVYAALTLIVIAGSKGQHLQANRLFDLGRLVAVAGIVLMVIVSGSLYKIAALHRGGSAVAQLLGGVPVDPGTVDLAERRLLNVVEEMALASGTPVPTVYVLDGEPSINAFAAGFDPGDAVIAVSRGCLDYLTRDELQGVIGHEFSHILNGDMTLNLRLIGVLHGILLIGLIGYSILRWTSDGSSSRRSSDDKKDGGSQLFLIGVSLLVIGYVGVFFGRLIKCAISRQREFLADASSIQFTRNPDGIGGALKKIGGLAEGSRIRSANAEQACHMFFGQGVSAWTELLATHPPLAERIRRIDPSFDGTFPDVRRLAPGEGDEATSGVGREAPSFLRRSVATAVLGDATDGGLAGSVEVPLDPEATVATVGAPTREHVDYAGALLASLPGPLLEAAREPFSARAVVYALLLDDEGPVRRGQLQHLEDHDEPGTAAEVARLLPQIGPLGAAARIPLVDLALPALRRLSPAQYAGFRASIEPLVQADRQVSLFEFALQRMLLRHLDEHFGRRRPAKVRVASIGPVLGDLATVLSALAHLGQDAEADVARAFDQGARRLGTPGETPALVPRDRCSLAAIDEALDRLATASPAIKKQLLDASAACIATDGTVTVAEGELLRAIADALDCPMPPLLGPSADGPGSPSARAADRPSTLRST